MPDDTGQLGPDGQPSPDQAAQDWRQSLPEDIRGEKTFEKFVKDGKLDFGNVARSYSALEKKQGGSITVPGEGADEATVKEFYKKLGVPDSPDAYTATLPDLHVGWNWDDALVGEWKAYAHKHGLTPKQFQAGIDFYGSYQNKFADAMDQAVRLQEGELQKDYGANYSRVKELARRSLLTYDQEHGGTLGAELHKELLPYHPRLLRVLAWLGERGAEAGFIDGSFGGVSSKAEAEQRIKEIMDPKGMKDNNSAYYNAAHPNHQAAVDEVMNLRRIAAGLK